MKPLKTSIGLIALAMSAGLASCGGSSGPIENAIEYFPFQLESDGKWGMIDKDGEVLFSEEFKSEPSPVIDGVFFVSEGDGYTLYKASDKPKPINGCEKLLSVGIMTDGIVPISRENERITIINKSGETVAVLNPVAGKEIVYSSPMYSDGLLVAMNQDEKYGAVDKSGKVAVDFKYDQLYNFSEGYAFARKETNSGSKIIVLDKKGKEIASLKKDYSLVSTEFNHGLALVTDDDMRYGFVDTKGEFKRAPGKVQAIGDFNSDNYVYANDSGEWGVMNMDGDVVIRAKYNSLKMLNDDRYLAVNRDEYLILDSKGETIKEFDEYSWMSVLPGSNNLIARENSHYILIDDNGKALNKEEYKDITISPRTMTIMSDFFNVDGIVADVLESIKDNGIGKYKIGQRASQLGLSAEDYAGSYSFRDESLNKTGYKYQIHFSGQTNERIAESNWDPYSYQSHYSFNPSSEVETLIMEVSTDRDCWDKVKAKLFSDLKAKGYKLAWQSDNDYFGFENGKTGIVIRRGGYGFAIGLVSKSTLDRNNPNGSPGDSVVVEEVTVEEVDADSTVAVADVL